MAGRDGGRCCSSRGGPSSSTSWRTTGLTPAFVTAMPPNMTCAVQKCEHEPGGFGRWVSIGNVQIFQQLLCHGCNVHSRS